MRTLTVPAAVLFLSLITVACQDTPQPLAVDPVEQRAQLMGSVDGNNADDGQNYVGRIIVITDREQSSAVACGEAFLDYDGAVIINPGGDRAIITVVGIDPNLRVEPGDRFEITAQTPCDPPAISSLNLTLEPITHGR